METAYNVSRTTSEPIQILTEVLDKDITLSELESSIEKLKNGKAVAEDGIMNEFLKNTSRLMRQTIVKVFNDCLEQSLIGSNLGKLFAGVLLNRLLMYRNVNCPDPLNQLGFFKGAQTSDHTFVLNTCIQKYL